MFPERTQDGILAALEVTLAWVDARIFAAGGEHIPEHWDEFAGQTGIEAVLHLHPGRPSAFVGGPPTSFLWLDISSEADADMGACWAAGQFVLTSLERGQRVLLHSTQGRHRVRWAFVAFLICSGKTAPAALRTAGALPWLGPYRTRTAAWDQFADFVRTQAEPAVAPR
ncbi:MAG: hypothetical protein WD906_01975 [Anaerolineales bacterium]